MEFTKKQWSKPVLIIIGRSTPEEAVLGECRNLSKTGPVLLGCNASSGNCQGMAKS